MEPRWGYISKIKKTFFLPSTLLSPPSDKFYEIFTFQDDPKNLNLMKSPSGGEKFFCYICGRMRYALPTLLNYDLGPSSHPINPGSNACGGRMRYTPNLVNIILNVIPTLILCRVSTPLDHRNIDLGLSPIPYPERRRRASWFK